MTSASRTRSNPSQASLFSDAASTPDSAVTAPPQSASAATPPTLEAQFAALPTAWRTHLRPFIDSDAYAPLCRFVDGERAAGKTV